MSTKLYVRLKELKAQYSLSFAEIFVLLIQQIPRPDDFQNDYELSFKGKKNKKLDLRISFNTKMSITTFAAAFRNLDHAIDYLLIEEKKIRMNRINPS